MVSVESLSAATARRIALAAQGIGAPPPASVQPRRLHQVLRSLGQLQIDSVNVYARAHYVPLFSRLGPYDPGALDGLAGRKTIEYWPHQAGLISIEDWPLWAWRREAYATQRALHWFDAHHDLVDWVVGELASRGPLTSSDLDHERNRSTGNWWGWSDVKQTLEYLWRTGDVICLRRRNFERLYELPDALPAAARSELANFHEAHRILLERAARALGVFTEADLADYWRMARQKVRPIIQELVEEGLLTPVRVEGWNAASGSPLPAWLHRDARRPRKIEAATVLSPFDPLLWFRPRAERLFNFEYRIEIYTPAPKRVYGYYSLPVLLDERVIGRVDLKAERSRRTLLVQSAWAEPELPSDAVERLPGILSDAASWQGLTAISSAGVGNLPVASGAVSLD